MHGSRSWTSRVYGFFKSLKLAVVLILYLVAVSILATLIPQGRENHNQQNKRSDLLHRDLLYMRLLLG